ncbi:MAG: hypothetical protein KDH94_04650, partial [Coxiellaceae bacterium]|nr:hypothetical protein [Coxiellaceae bacterium]
MSLEKMLASAYGLKQQLIEWRQRQPHIEGSTQLANVLRQPGGDPIFYDPQVVEYALLAFENGQISQNQFCSVTLLSNTIADYFTHLTKLEYLCVTEQHSDNNKRLLDFIVLPETLHAKFIQLLTHELVLPSERQFHVIHLEDGVQLPPLYRQLQQCGFTAFMPQLVNGRYQIIVPSLTMLQTFVGILSRDDFTFQPEVGFGSKKQWNSLTLSIPGYHQASVNGDSNKTWLPVLHQLLQVTVFASSNLIALLCDRERRTSLPLQDAGDLYRLMLVERQDKDVVDQSFFAELFSRVARISDLSETSCDVVVA